MNVLITGANGQVGRALRATAPAAIKAHSLSHQELDITDAASVRRAMDELRPALVINAAAYTAVDKAETDEAGAHAGNAAGPRHLAEAVATRADCRLIHVSTDFVFSGAASVAYTPDAATGPLSVYGRSKLAGEAAVREVLGDAAVIVRTAWVYAANGRNFLSTMLRLMKEKGSVRVVGDQVGTPTSANSLAGALWRLAQLDEWPAVLHWTDSGVASWYDFAVAIADDSAALGLLPADVKVVPITTAEYPTPARRPSFSVLDKSAAIRLLGIVPAHWRHNLRRELQELAHA